MRWFLFAVLLVKGSVAIADCELTELARNSFSHLSVEFCDEDRASTLCVNATVSNTGEKIKDELHVAAYGCDLSVRPVCLFRGSFFKYQEEYDPFSERLKRYVIKEARTDGVLKVCRIENLF